MFSGEFDYSKTPDINSIFQTGGIVRKPNDVYLGSTPTITCSDTKPNSTSYTMKDLGI